MPTKSPFSNIILVLVANNLRETKKIKPINLFQIVHMSNIPKSPYKYSKRRAYKFNFINFYSLILFVHNKQLRNIEENKN